AWLLVADNELSRELAISGTVRTAQGRQRHFLKRLRDYIDMPPNLNLEFTRHDMNRKIDGLGRESAEVVARNLEADDMLGKGLASLLEFLNRDGTGEAS